MTGRSGQYFAAFHGQNDIVAARISGDDVEFRAQHRVERAGKLNGVITGPVAADRQFLGAGVVERLDARRVPRDAYAHLIVRTADPGESRSVELGALLNAVPRPIVPNTVRSLGTTW
jgi:hypothetical protein